jgi:iron(III) transport system ATP-binding protein
MSENGFTLERVAHAFDGVVVVDDLTMSVGRGEIVCLLGPSGCGKTTTLRIAAGLETLQQGVVVIDGRIVARPGQGLPPEARGVGMVFQDYALFPHLSVLENVAFGIHGQAPDERRAVALDLLERLRMTRFQDAYPHTLSGGEQQRVALARALAPRPAVMLMDEPFSGLDVRLRDAVREDTLSLLREEGAATLMVTHDPDEAMRMADRIAVMRAGRIVQEDAPDEIYRHPKSRFIAEFFSELNVLSGTVEADGRVRTSVGTVLAKGVDDGTSVEVLARPEAVRINGLDDGMAATVVEARSLGPFGIVELRLGGDGERVKCRVPRAALPAPGTEVAITLDPEQTFVFPRGAD